MTAVAQMHVAPFELGILLYPGFTLLDLAGPQGALGMHSRTHLVAATRDPVVSDTGPALVPTCTFEDAPTRFDVLFVPGGARTNKALEDARTLRFLRAHGKSASWVTSVCSGSLLLAAAGLLEGHRAATHWLARDVLAAFGVEVSTERVAVDGNRVTGGGATAGLDFGLVLLAKLCGEAIARMTQLALEYDPKPPYDVGTPERAGLELTERTRGMLVAAGITAIDVGAIERARTAAGVA